MLGLVLVVIIAAVVLAVRRVAEVTGPPPVVASPSAPPTSSASSAPSRSLSVEPTEIPPPPSGTAPSTPPSTPPSTMAPSTAPPPAGALASDAVLGYLRALAAGNADAALRYAARPVNREATLSNAVLAESRRRAPVTGIQVAAVADPGATQVQASYRLGSTPVNGVFEVVKVNGGWRLRNVVNEFNLGLVRQQTIPMKINGATVTNDRVQVLPGSYAFSTGTRYLSYGGRNVLLVRSPDDLVNVYGLRGGLTSSGRQKVKAVARNSFNACLRSEVAKPKNCPFRWDNSTYRYINGSLNWRRVGGDPFRKARISYSDVGGAVVSISFKVRISGDCRFDGQRGTCSGRVTGTGVGNLRLTRSPLKVDWLL